MSYTPNTWATGDVVTAAKLNNMEQGIAAVGGSIAVVELSAEGFSSGSRIFGYIVYAKNEEGTWVIHCDDDNEWETIGGLVEPYKLFEIVAIPSNENVKPYLLNAFGDTIPVNTGGVSTSETTLYFTDGSAVTGKAYCISGDGSVCWDSR